ncbi:2-amino-4-hydroxy-6-hydroxymethyldihydropteridinediphosphokinase [Cribrihabitans marinus]|uniref:2-amino-4-hydroxy-6-hydroxymethyldihydropteridine pyrophosphokinase n=1 Tax=Cribrihabitans marinus TaxID=1227549 RepID=A0A1H7DG40_9RHOB|nr:2-amino-4-hydroxy-6-hydroxymethyldihydropteridine diphosphokinase [Cribrihabitans marinus]GGH38841.1 2-amino-4-hydroxy-6-hydroxymethyldihydropteridine pyrophosphokinase [Cribrihabitans marinus]SEK00324.1 2-amino-4-hydroxy-6-hydroxymethyldihydropteridinediphosphokinase [Cribrihabitans marinus]
MTEFRSVSLIALGANLPQGRFSPELTLGRACVALSDAGVVIRAVSRFYATPCFPAGAGPDYVNAVLAVDAGDDPSDLLALLHRIEREHGRERVRRWGMRTLDMDIVAFGDAVLPDAGIYSRWRDLRGEEQRQHTPDRLILPHPRLQDRAFVLIPAADVAPGWRHPVSGWSIAEMCSALPAADRAAVTPI